MIRCDENERHFDDTIASVPPYLIEDEDLPIHADGKVHIAYAIEWLDEDPGTDYPIRFDVGHVVYDTACGEIIHEGHTTRSSVTHEAYDAFKMPWDEYDWRVEQEEAEL